MEVYVFQGYLEPDPYVRQGNLGHSYIADGQQDAASPNSARNQDTEAVKQTALLLKEIDETNNWARLAFQLYFGWFALQFTINALAISWLFTPRSSMPTFANSAFLIFIGWNLMGTIGTLLVHKGLLACDLRISEVTERLDQNHVTEVPDSRPRSPMPRQAINQVFGLCAITMLMSLGFWIIFLVQQQGR